MGKNNNEIHLDVYLDRQELHIKDSVTTYYEGIQSAAAKSRYEKIKKAFANHYLEEKLKHLDEVDFSELSDHNKGLLISLVDGFTSQVGRGLLGVAFLQLAIKSIAPEQSVRLHKGSKNRKSFSWQDGISMRLLNSHYTTKFLRDNGLLNSNKDGSFMTRTLAENYPYSRLYKAEMRGPFEQWIAIVDAIEDGTMPAELGLSYLMVLLKKRSDDFLEIAKEAVDAANKCKRKGFEEIKALMMDFYNTTYGRARAFEVVMHGFMQAMSENNLIGDLELVPLSQMRSANKKHGNVGDVELSSDDMIEVSWDAKYGKTYLEVELGELRDKLLYTPSVEIAGFVGNEKLDKQAEIMDKVNEISLETGVEIKLFSFEEWIQYLTEGMDSKSMNNLAQKWLIAVVETFALRRPEIAPIEEPSDVWLKDFTRIMSD